MPSIANLVCELPHEFSNDFRPRILGNKKIIRKSQIFPVSFPEI